MIRLWHFFDRLLVTIIRLADTKTSARATPAYGPLASTDLRRFKRFG
ncbi:hypothetical protein SSPSH_003662 [Salinisphaera shabanensis E1L3A]|uniref:Uncharacterized protein n=1 Tax=Salinisphaera shabanensis E1L3A TaxID=1033802 RepID=U2EGP0_9GAMM|nr:hypothetical protein SSPSH_003662 [Salinisphaera shabanensis E1L3A]